MPRWLGYVLALVIVAALAPVAGWLGRRHGGKIKRGAAMASLLLGFGMPFDPPTKHLVEAKEDKAKGPAESGDPPTV